MTEQQLKQAMAMINGGLASIQAGVEALFSDNVAKEAEIKALKGLIEEMGKKPAPAKPPPNDEL